MIKFNYIMIVCWVYWLLPIVLHCFAPHIFIVCKYRMRITLLEEWQGGIAGYALIFWKIYILEYNFLKSSLNFSL